MKTVASLKLSPFSVVMDSAGVFMQCMFLKVDSFFLEYER